uniref:DUF962 domain-containing protein n=1 Tax=Arcella intermedia TaxID=1963864 RepID=A0A6B2LP64_9EUKA
MHEHSDPVCKVLHVIGTSIVVVLLAFNPKVLLSLLFSAGVGYSLCEMLSTLPHGFLEFAIVGLTFISLNYLSTGRLHLTVPIAGYTFAWVGHFIFENNRPATFTYPTYSLMGDFRMWFDVLSGRVLL